jgi:type VI secretion system protein ImpH
MSRLSLAGELRRLVIAEGSTFPFFRAISILERAAPSGAVGIGALGPAAREAVRFVHDSRLIFPAGDIAYVHEKETTTGSWWVEVSGTFLGLVGPTSPLPTYFSEELIESELQDNERSLRTLYDILHHRLYSLFYRAGRKYRASAEARQDGRDAFTRRALAFVGVDATAMPTRGLSAAHLLGLAPLFAIRTRSPRALRVLMESALPGIPVGVEAYVERTVVLEESERNKLGVQNSVLGESFTIGARVQDRSGRFRTKLGPVPYDVLEDLMPGGRYHERLRDTLDQFTRGILEAEVEVLLTGDDTPRFRLGVERGGRLGINTTIAAAEAKGQTRVRFTMTEDPAGVRPQVIGAETMGPPSKAPAA